MWIDDPDLRKMERRTKSDIGLPLRTTPHKFNAIDPYLMVDATNHPSFLS